VQAAAVFEPALPGRRTMASGSPVPSAPWSANAQSGWNPNVFFQVGAAFSFSNSRDHDRRGRVHRDQRAGGARRGRAGQVAPASRPGR
jgi:hypothetical protein